MTYPPASTLALLTREQVGLRLELTPQSVDGLVKAGELSPVRVSSAGDRRFWPDEIMAYALRAAMSADAGPTRERLPEDPDRLPAATPPAPTISAIRAQLSRNGRTSRYPAWPPFTGPAVRRVHAYIAFADRAHLVSYLRHRAEDELV